jgi:hypothetical protein
MVGVMVGIMTGMVGVRVDAAKLNALPIFTAGIEA